MSEISDEDFREYLKNPIMFPTTFKDWLGDYFATNIPKLHVSQVYGFKLQSVKDATEITAQNTITSTTYAAAGTDGPNMEGIVNGFYLAMFGGTVGSTAGTPSYDTTLIYMSPVIDGAAATDNNAAIMNAGSNGRVLLIDLTAGDHQHTIGFHYKKSGVSNVRAVWNRWCYLIKVVSDE